MRATARRKPPKSRLKPAPNNADEALTFAREVMPHADPDQLEALPRRFVQLWQQVEDDILQDIARRMKSLGELDPLTPTAIWQAWRLAETRAVRSNTVATLARYTGKSRAEIKRLLETAGAQTLAADDAVYTAAGLDPPRSTSPLPLSHCKTLARKLPGSSDRPDHLALPSEPTSGSFTTNDQDRPERTDQNHPSQTTESTRAPAPANRYW